MTTHSLCILLLPQGEHLIPCTWRFSTLRSLSLGLLPQPKMLGASLKAGLVWAQETSYSLKAIGGLLPVSSLRLLWLLNNWFLRRFWHPPEALASSCCSAQRPISSKSHHLQKTTKGFTGLVRPSHPESRTVLLIKRLEKRFACGRW